MFLSVNKGEFEGVGLFPFKQKIILKEGVTPSVKAPYRIALSLKARLLDTLNKYEKFGFVKKVTEPTEWVNNLTIVEKTDGSLRLCLDPKELNTAIKRELYHIPSLEEMTPILANKKWFTVLDMKDGFMQLELDDQSSKLCTFHTPFGRYRFLRMPFGLSSSPEIFQRAAFQAFGDLEGVIVYFDDLIVSAETIPEHDKLINQVMNRAKEFGIKFNKTKIQFRIPEVKYLGQIFTHIGMSPDPERVKAILDLKEPNNKVALQSIMGLVGYLGSFIPNLSQLTAPLRELLKKDVLWCWEMGHSEALNKIKKLVASAPVLKYFDPKKQLLIQTDSSKDGLGSCLMADGEPIGYASRSLTDAEKRYAQIEKEMLAIKFAAEKFHTFVYGRKVKVHTDHKPLEAIFKKDLGQLTARIQRMRLALLRYDLDVHYKPGPQMHVADALSRNFPDAKVKDDPVMQERVHAVDISLPITTKKLLLFQETSECDPVIKQVKTYCMNGWPEQKNHVNPTLRELWNLREHFRVKQGLVLMDHKIFVPEKLRTNMLSLVHEGHLGIVKCKKRARQALYWPKMAKEIEEMVQRCRVCKKFQPNNVKEPLIQYPVVERSPQMLLNRVVRTRIPTTAEVLSPCIVENPKSLLIKNRKKREMIYNKQTKFRKDLKEGDSVLLRRGKEWESGVITDTHESPRSYMITTAGGDVYRRNKWHIRRSHNPPPVVNKKVIEGLEELEATHHNVVEGNNDETSTDVQSDRGYVTRSGRQVIRPLRYKDYVCK